MGEADEVGVDIGERLFERITDAGLSGEVHENVEALAREKALDRRAIGNVDRRKAEARVCLEPGKARLFQRDVVVGRQVVDAIDALAPLQEARCEGEADKPRGAGDKHRHRSTQFGLWILSARSLPGLSRKKSSPSTREAAPQRLAASLSAFCDFAIKPLETRHDLVEIVILDDALSSAQAESAPSVIPEFDHA